MKRFSLLTNRERHSTPPPRTTQDRRWCSDRRIDERRWRNVPVEEERRNTPDRRAEVDRRSLADRRGPAQRVCQVVLANGHSCRRPAILHVLELDAWVCLHHVSSHAGSSPDLAVAGEDALTVASS